MSADEFADAAIRIMAESSGAQRYMTGPSGDWSPCDAWRYIEGGEAEVLTEQQGLTMIAELGGKIEDLPGE